MKCTRKFKKEKKVVKINGDLFLQTKNEIFIRTEFYSLIIFWITSFSAVVIRTIYNPLAQEDV